MTHRRSYGEVLDEMDHQAKYQQATGDNYREQELRIQALGAAISRRDWHAAERAYEAIRDRFYARGTGAADMSHEGGTEHRTWSRLDAVTQSALRCKDPVFWAFLRERGFIINNEEAAAVVVCGICQIDSRRELVNQVNAEAIWHDLDDLFQTWLRFQAWLAELR